MKRYTLRGTGPPPEDSAMNNERVDLIERFRFLHTPQLLDVLRSEPLSGLARQVATEELRRRGLDADGVALPHGPHGPDPAAQSGQDFVTVAKYFLPMDAHIVCGCLAAAGVAATVADAHLLQTDSLLTPALGGVRILVPADQLQRAHAVIDAFNRGEFQLEDDIDVGPA
jgi:hypothetical protein